MFRNSKVLATVLIGCGLVASAWLVTHRGSRESSEVVAVTPIRSDDFANQLNQKITNVARLTGGHTRAVILDNDAAMDDVLALILIGNDPGVVLKAITVAGTGEAHGKQGAQNMAAIVNMMGKSDIPVAYGHARPLTNAGKPFPDFLRTTADRILVGKKIKPHPDLRITDDAVGLIKQVVDNSDEKVTILATGPLTNIAEFVTQYPELTKKIDRIVVMGGAINVKGNINALTPEANNTVSEWNFYADPQAVRKVFSSKIPITLVALDATNQVPITAKFYDSLALEDQPELHLAHDLLKGYVDQYGLETMTNNVYMWDGLAAMVMLDPAMAEIKSIPLVVDTTNGQIKVASKGDKHIANIDVVTRVLKPESALVNYVAMVKSNHIFAQRQMHHDFGRATAQLGRVVTYLGHMDERRKV
jgi:inosine-uridine nucleoside N-ribohydrolase